VAARATVGAAAALGAAWSAPALAPVVPALAGALGVPQRAPGAGVLLTFDDGPHPVGTPLVLDALRKADLAATFFLVGEQVQRYRSLAVEIVAAGHHVAIHGFRHRVQLRLTPRMVADDLDRAADIIGVAAGIEPTLHRPPLGIYSPAGLAAVRARGWQPILWSRWGRDWRRSATPKSIANTIGTAFEPGEVLLLHDADHYSAEGSHRKTAAALPQIFGALAASGRGAMAGWRV
jgi:peptidoglycan/xylan/chitin deacetylase (PgdA/CDA1 family)